MKKKCSNARRKYLKKLTVKRHPGPDTSLGLLHYGHQVIPCRLGKAGITVLKCEGDGATPTGEFSLLYGYARRRLVQPVVLKFRLIGSDDGWCDDPDLPQYNRPVKLPFPGSHEIMTRKDRLYDVCIVLDYNMHPRARGKGSAIFFHLTHPQGRGTEGCVAITPDHMRRLLPFLSHKTVMQVCA